MVKGFWLVHCPVSRTLKQIPKRSLLPVLKHASKRTTKGPYDKTRHAFALLARIDPQKLRIASPHAGRLFDVLIQRTNA